MICSSAIPQPIAIRPAIIGDVPKLYMMIQKLAADLGPLAGCILPKTIGGATASARMQSLSP
jgi:hypothetical protein